MEYNNKSIKHWNENDRPRERLLHNGANTLTDSELLAILIGSGTIKLSAIDLAKKILSSYAYDLDKFARATPAELMKFEGIGMAKAVTISAALELGRRRKIAENKKIIIRNPQDIANIMTPLLQDLNHEEVWIILFNNQNKILHKQLISKGGFTMSTIDIREILKIAIDFRAVKIALVHNHPSGNLQPSDADISITKKLFKAAELLDIVLIDHLIIAENNFFSFQNENLL